MFVSGLLLIPSASFAMTKNQLAIGSVTIQTLGEADPAILVSNPFYWITDLTREVKEGFSSGVASRAVNRIDALNRKAAELLKAKTIIPENKSLVIRSVQEYQITAYQYALRMDQLKAVDLRNNPELTDLFIGSFITHLRLLDDLLSSDKSSNHQAIFSDVRDQIAVSGARLVGLVGIDKLESYIAGNLDSSNVEMVRTAEVLVMIAKKSVTNDELRLAKDLLTLHTNLLSKFAVNLTGLNAKQSISELLSLTGGEAERTQTLSYFLSLKFLVGNQQLTGLRDQLLIRVFSR